MVVCLKVSELLRGGRIQQINGSILEPTSGGQILTVEREGERLDLCDLPGPNTEFLAGRRAGSQDRAVRRVLERQDPALVSLEGHEFLAGGRVPKADAVSETAAHHGLAIG